MRDDPDYDFPVRWYRNEIAKARKEIAQVEKAAAPLKNQTGYHRAYHVVIAMRRAALAAILTIPEPQPGEVYTPSPKPPEQP